MNEKTPASGKAPGARPTLGVDMNTIATATTHPALILRNAVDAITTELIRADPERA